MDECKQDDMKVDINYNITPDELPNKINAAIDDELNYQISDTYIGYNTNHHKPIMLIYGSNINYIKKIIMARHRKIYHEISIKISSSIPKYPSQRGFTNLINEISDINMNDITNNKMVYIPIISKDMLVAAIFKLQLPAANAVSFNVFIETIKFKLIANEKLYDI